MAPGQKPLCQRGAADAGAAVASTVQPVRISAAVPAKSCDLILSSKVLEESSQLFGLRPA
jgi:hypothetical protein